MISQEQISAAVSDLKNAIQGAAGVGMTDRRGHANGTAKVSGYVCNIHGDDDEDESLRGTVDVQEYNCSSEDNNGEPEGFHEGVLLSAIEDNRNGYRIIPCMYSEVIITKDPLSLQEYVVMYSHVNIVEIKAHEEVDIDVTEYKDFEESDDGIEKDYNELEETGNKSTEKHTATEITKEVVNNDGGNKDEMLADKRTFTIKDTTITFDGTTVSIQTSDSVSIQCETANIKADSEANIQTKTVNINGDSEVKIKTNTANVEGSNVTVKGSQVKITGGQLTTKGMSNTDLNGPFNAIKMCPFSGAPHCGSMVSGT